MQRKEPTVMRSQIVELNNWLHSIPSDSLLWWIVAEYRERLLRVEFMEQPLFLSDPTSVIDHHDFGDPTSVIDL